MAETHTGVNYVKIAIGMTKMKLNKIVKSEGPTGGHHVD
jgi:hypothetical protein